MTGPLQLIVAGRVSAGKSTLVNALIGRRVAETAAAETTRLPACYRYGPADRVERTAWGLDITVPAAALRDLTIIDTPGLGSPSRPDPKLIGRAEAMLYVLNQTVRADDAALLSAFQDANRGHQPGPCASIAVLSKADTVTGSAGEVAERAAVALGPRICGVLPMVGLLAESAETGRFDAADVAVLQACAELPGLDLLTSSSDEFLEAPVPVPTADRRRVLERLGLAGVRQVTAMLVAEPEVPIAELRRRLVVRSGLPELRDRIEQVLLNRADAVKAGAALAAITALCRRDPREAAIARDGTEALLARPESHQLRMLDVLNRICGGAVELPPDLAAEVTALATDGAGLTSERALDRAQWWRSFSVFGATPDQARVADVVHRAYFLKWQGLK